MSIESQLVKQGVFKGMHGLEALAKADDFWAQRPYGTRLYYGNGELEYLHRSVLESAIKAMNDLEEKLAAEEKENQQLHDELEKVKADNEQHRKLNLEYENQLIEARRELAEAQEDSRRLDWMDKRRTNHIYQHFQFHASNAASCLTWRVAIDTAMKE